MTSVAEDNETGDQAQAAEQRKRPLPSYDDVNTPVILLVGVISAILTFLIIAFVQGLFYQWQNSYIRQRSYEVVNTDLKQTIDDQKALLAGSETTISIQQAMQQVITDYGQSSPGAGGPPETPSDGEPSSQ